MLNDKTTRGIYAPSYYNEFKCIADKCHHNCCIDWEICIDDATYEKYKRIGHIFDTVKECEDGPCFALTENGRCPHLNESGLCDIILTHGEKFLSEICQNHPRFFNYITADRTEAGLGIVCEEACRLILENDKPFALTKVEDLDDDDCDYDCDFDPLPHRERIISTLESTDSDFEAKLAVLRDSFDIPREFDPDEWLERFLSLEILDADWERCLRESDGSLLRTSSENSRRFGKYYERLLIYFVYRHVSVAYSRENLRARLAFAILSVDVIRSLFEDGLTRESDADSAEALSKLIDTARRYSAEIEYSEDNTAELVLAFENLL